MRNCVQMVALAGWGQRAGTLSFLDSAFGKTRNLVSSSVYDLALQQTEQGGDGKDNYPPGCCSLYAAALAGLLKQGQQNIVIGWSMGGMVAIELASYFPQLVHKLILIGTSVRFVSSEPAEQNKLGAVPEGELLSLATLLKSSPNTAFQLFCRKLLGSGAGKDDLEQRVGEMSRMSLEILAHGLRYLQFSDLSQLLPEIKIPVLVLHGLKDSIVPVQSARYLSANLAKGKLVLFEDGSHVLAEQYSDLVVEIISEFLVDNE